MDIVLPTREEAGGELVAAQRIADDGPYAAALRHMVEDRRSAATKRAYAGDLARFFKWWRGTNATPEALRQLCDQNAAQLAVTLNGYAAAMRGQKLTEATSNRHMSAIRSILRTARKFGAGNPDPAGLVASEKVVTYRDTRGPSLAEVSRLLAAPDRTTPKGRRDFAMLVILWENALRRSEICEPNAGHFDAQQRRLSIIGKGKGTQREYIDISERAALAVAAYHADRGTLPADAPLFANLARFNPTETRLSADGLHDIINGYGIDVLGRALHPHAFRHAAITAALDATQGNVRMVQGLSRHADVRTLIKYDDARQNQQGKVTAILSNLA